MPRKREVLQSPPLAWDHDGEPFEVPADAVAWKVRRYTGKPGYRPLVVWTECGPLHLSLNATMQELRRAVEDKPGAYRLYPVDASGRELEPVAVIEIVAPRDPSPCTCACHAAEHPEPETDG